MGTDRAIRGKQATEISTSNPKRSTSHAVIVVPIFAPRRIPADCVSETKPALTKLTVITVVAEEDCECSY